MNEVFYEESAVVENRKSALKRYNLFKLVQIASYVFMGLWIFVVIHMVHINMFKFFVGVIMLLIPLIMFFLMGFFAGKMKKNAFVDYDYTFVSGSLRFSKIIRENKRFFITEFDCKKIEKIGLYGSETFSKYEKLPGIRKLVLTSNVNPAENKNLYYLVANFDADKKLIILECTETFIVNILKFTNARAVIEEGFGRK